MVWYSVETVKIVFIGINTLSPFSRWTWVSWCQNVSVLDIIEANGDGGVVLITGVIRSVEMLPLTNQHLVFFHRPDALPVTQPTVSEHSLSPS